MPRHNPLEDVIRTLGGGARPANSSLAPGGQSFPPGPTPQPQVNPQQQQLRELIMKLLQNPELLQQLLGQGGRQLDPMPQMRQPPPTIGPI